MIKLLNGIEIEYCRGTSSRCKNAILSPSDLVDNIIAISTESLWNKKFLNLKKTPKKHQLLKIGISACPNACAKSQIKDLGVIVRSYIDYDESLCTNCGECRNACKEGAISVDSMATNINKDKCLGCLDCVRACEYGALYSSKIYFEVLIGGRLGRHPKFATPILKTDPNRFLDFYKYFLGIFDQYPDIYCAKEILQNLSIGKIKDEFLKI